MTRARAAAVAGVGGNGARRRGVARLGTAVVVAGAVAAGGCALGQPVASPTTRAYAGETRSTDTAVTGGRVIYGVPAETSSFNPTLAMWASYSLTTARSIYDTLAAYDEHGGVQPFLAERFDHSPDHRTWTVTLRDGVRYTNGKPFTAESFVRAQRAMKASPVIGEAFNPIDSWDVVDDRTFVVHTTLPWTSFPHAMTSQIGVAVDPDWLASEDFTHPVGTGPFVVDRWDVNREMVLTRNPDYWRADERGTRYPYLDGIVFRIIVDEAERYEALRRGAIDILQQNYATPSVARKLESAGPTTHQAFSDSTSETPEDYLLLNTSVAPLDDVEARRAIAHAIDKDDYVEKVTGGLDEPADGPWKPGSTWHTPVDYPRYDPAEARRLVDAVKARNGGSFTVTVLGNPGNESTRIQHYLQDQLAKVGIEMKVESVPQQSKIVRMLQGSYQVVLTQQFDMVHPFNESIYWNDWNRPSGALTLDFSRLHDPELTRLLLDAAGAAGAAEKELFAAVARRQAQLMPHVWLAHASRTVIADPRLVNVVRSTLPDGSPALDFLQGSHSVHQIWIAR